MAVSTVHTKDILMGDGVNTKFPFTFQVIEKSQINCLKVLKTGEEIEVLSTEFDVVLNDKGANGGEITYPLLGEPLEDGCKFIIFRNTEIKQDYTPPNGQVFDAVAIKTEIDRLTMQNQEQSEALERSVQTSIGSEADPKEYLDKVNEMLSNARELQESAINITSQNIKDVTVQVQKAADEAKSATDSKDDAVASAKAAAASALKAAESAASLDGATLKKIGYEKVRTIPYDDNVTLTLQDDDEIIVLSQRSSTITIDTSALTFKSPVFTVQIIFEAYNIITPKISFAGEAIKWINGYTPYFAAETNHLIVLRKFQNGNLLGSDGGSYFV